MALFRDRKDAGQQLGAHLQRYAESRNAIVLALPRGGVPIGYEIAKLLKIPLDVYLVRKLGVPGQEELAMGAVASGGSYVADEDIVAAAGVSPEIFRATLVRELVEMHRRETLYREGRPQPRLAGKSVIVVDDGLATGATMYSAIQSLRQQQPAEVIVAVPVASREAVRRLELLADRVLCPYQPAYFGSVGAYYDNFSQVGDAEVSRLLEASERERATWKVA